MEVSRVADLKAAASLDKSIRDKVVKYMIYAYDKGTPIVRKEMDLDKRKKRAAVLAGFTTKDKKLFEDVSSLRVAAYRNLLSEMLVAQNNRLWTKIIAQEKYFIECSEVLIKSVELESDKDIIAALEKKSKLSKEMDEIDERLRRYWAEFLKGDEEAVEIIRSNSASPEARMAMKYAN